METFYEPLLQMETFVQAREELLKATGLLLLTGCVESQKTHLMYGLGRDWPDSLPKQLFPLNICMKKEKIFCWIIVHFFS